MKKTKSIKASLIAAVLLASVSMSASADIFGIHSENGHWAPYNDGVTYFFMCTIGGKCEGSKWR